MFIIYYLRINIDNMYILSITKLYQWTHDYILVYKDSDHSCVKYIIIITTKYKIIDMIIHLTHSKT